MVHFKWSPFSSAEGINSIHLLQAFSVEDWCYWGYMIRKAFRGLQILVAFIEKPVEFRQSNGPSESSNLHSDFYWALGQQWRTLSEWLTSAWLIARVHVLHNSNTWLVLIIPGITKKTPRAKIRPPGLITLDIMCAVLPQPVFHFFFIFKQSGVPASFLENERYFSTEHSQFSCLYGSLASSWFRMALCFSKHLCMVSEHAFQRYAFEYVNNYEKNEWL